MDNSPPPDGAQPIAGNPGSPQIAEAPEQLVKPLVSATCSAFAEMARTDVSVRAAYRTTTLDRTLSDISAVLALRSEMNESLVLSFPEKMAKHLAERVLAGVTGELDQELIRDCMGEIANVIAGQAKALLADTAYRFDMSVPKIVSRGDPALRFAGMDCLTIIFGCDLGDFAMHLVVDSSQMQSARDL